MPLPGGEESEVLTDVEGESWPNWEISSTGIYFLHFARFPPVTIDFLEFSTGKTFPIWTLERKPGWGLSVSHDGKSIVYVQNEFAESNIMLVKNFR